MRFIVLSKPLLIHGGKVVCRRGSYPVLSSEPITRGPHRGKNAIAINPVSPSGLTWMEFPMPESGRIVDLAVGDDVTVNGSWGVVDEFAERTDRANYYNAMHEWAGSLVCIKFRSGARSWVDVNDVEVKR